ncbi:MAG: hypothetical protein AB8E15_03140 [Bdellovibrionales bacterium]
MGKSINTFFVVLAITVLGFANDPNYLSSSKYLDKLNGYVPLFDTGFIANDLEHNGSYIFPEKARELLKAGQIKDLSTLNPIIKDPVSGISLNTWRDEFPASPAPRIEISGSEFRFISYFGINPGVARILVEHINTEKLYFLSFGPRAQNLMMNQSLLHKIGYQMYPMSSMQGLDIEFDSELSKLQFFDKLSNDAGFKSIELEPTTTTSENLVCDLNSNLLPKYKISKTKTVSTNLSTLESKLEPWGRFFSKEDRYQGSSLRIKNAVLSPSDLTKYNLADAFFSKRVKGRRLYSALPIAYATVDLPESINLFSYSAGNLFEERFYLDFIYQNDYVMDLNDSRWIQRRINKLSEKDWLEIAQSTGFPQCVSGLLAEVLKSRSNSLTAVLGLLKTGGKELKVNYKYSPRKCRKQIKKGVLLQANYDGYGNDFVHDTYEGPLSGREIRSFLKSISASNIINYVVTQLNVEIPNTDIAQKDFEKRFDSQARQFAQFLQTGKFETIPFRSFRVPFLQGNVIYSRDLVPGNYLGTNNAVQLVDTYGYQIGGGYYFGFEGLDQGEILSARLSGSYLYLVNHIQPIELTSSLKNDSVKQKAVLQDAFEKQTRRLYDVLRVRKNLVKSIKKDMGQASLTQTFKSDIKNLFCEIDQGGESLLYMDFLAAANQVVDPNLSKEERIELVRNTAKEFGRDIFNATRPVGRCFDELNERLEFLDSAITNGNSRSAESALRGFSSNLIRKGFQDDSELIVEEIRKLSIDSADYNFQDIKNYVVSLPLETREGLTSVVDCGYTENQVLGALGGLASNYESSVKTIVKNQIDNKVNDFLSDFTVGSSLLVNRYYSLDANIFAGLGLSSVSSFFLDPSYGKLLAGRTHIHRLSNNIFQVYRSDVNRDIYGLLTGIRLYFNLLSIGKTWSFGEGTTRLYNLSIGAKKSGQRHSDDPMVLNKLDALADVIEDDDLSRLNKFSQIIDVEHNFKETQSSFSFLNLKKLGFSNIHKISVQEQGKENDDILRYSTGSRDGSDVSSLAVDLANVWIKEYSETDFTASLPNNSDPGRSFFGWSDARSGEMEILLPNQEFDSYQCMQVRFNFNKFKASPKEVGELVQSYESKFGQKLFDKEHLNRINEFHLLGMEIKISIYKSAIDHLLNSYRDGKHLMESIEEKIVFPKATWQARNKAVYPKRNQAWKNQRLRSKIRRQFNKAKENRNNASKEYVENVVKLVLTLEKHMFAGNFFEILGGKNNLSLVGIINAYRDGDEMFSPQMYLYTYGREPFPEDRCPSDVVAGKYNFMKSELLLQWLNTRLD